MIDFFILFINYITIIDYVLVVVMEDKLKFVVHGRKEGNRFVLEGITTFIMKSLESYVNSLESCVGWNNTYSGSKR